MFVSFWSFLVEEVSKAIYRLVSLMECDSSCVSLVIAVINWLVELRLVMVELRVLIKLESCSMSLDCSVVVALMKSLLYFSLLVIDWLWVGSCLKIVEVISVEIFMFSLWIIRNPTAFMMEKVITGSLFLRAVLNSIFASVSAV